MDAKVRPAVALAARQSRFDPAGEVDLQDPASVEEAVCSILDRRYGGRYDRALLHSAMADVARAYRGKYPGFLRCDCPYHDLSHCLETALLMARLLDGCAISQPPPGAGAIDADHALLGVVLALFHDIGMLRRDDEAHLWGPALTPVHEERGVRFLKAYLFPTTLRPLLAESELILATKLTYELPGSWTAGQRLLASMVATADLVSQISDRCYLEKCRDLLFLEFSAFGLAGRPDSIYPNSRILLEKTPEFVEVFLTKRLDEDFEGVRDFLRAHMSGVDPWKEAVGRNLAYLKMLLSKNGLDGLRRNPASSVAGVPKAITG